MVYDRDSQRSSQAGGVICKVVLIKSVLSDLWKKNKGEYMSAKVRNKKNKSPQVDPKEAPVRHGRMLLRENRILGRISGNYDIRISDKKRLGKETAAVSDSDGVIYLNKDISYSPKEWAYTIAHCMMHNVFGHFDAQNMPGFEKSDADGKKRHIVKCNLDVWNLACDIYVSKFLSDIKFAAPTCSREAVEMFASGDTDERKIYDRLMSEMTGEVTFTCGTASMHTRDMLGLEKPKEYDENYLFDVNHFKSEFADALVYSVSKAVYAAGGKDPHDHRTNPAANAAEWFMNHYPLLGGLAAGFKIIYDREVCQKNEIEIAAVDVSKAEIYVNPGAHLTRQEMIFVLAHEYLHAGLCHHERRQGRDPLLWNVACDFVINAWLKEMHVGMMPEKGCLYDEALAECSAEEIYDRMVSDLKKFSGLEGFRGYGKGDVIDGGSTFGKEKGAMDLDEFYKSALQNGLEYHIGRGRGFIPAGLEEEIRALAMPPIPWNAKLADWFDVHFSPLEKRRSYARPSRRQGETPDIPRPRCVVSDIPEYSRTFGVVIDTSGSMSAKMIGMALGAIASYSAARDVPYARVVFCDAEAFDAGYMSPEEAAGRVNVIGRGGTVLQPGIDLLQRAEDFPGDAPILIITDGYIESDLMIKREHAFLIPVGSRLPFKAKGEIFRLSE